MKPPPKNIIPKEVLLILNQSTFLWHSNMAKRDHRESQDYPFNANPQNWPAWASIYYSHRKLQRSRRRQRKAQGPHSVPTPEQTVQYTCGRLSCDMGTEEYNECVGSACGYLLVWLGPWTTKEHRTADWLLLSKLYAHRWMYIHDDPVHCESFKDKQLKYFRKQSPCWAYESRPRLFQCVGGALCTSSRLVLCSNLPDSEGTNRCLIPSTQ